MAIFQVGVVVNWRIDGMVPNIITIAIVVLVVQKNQTVPWINILGASVVLDTVNNIRIGESAFALIMILLMLELVKSRFVREGSVIFAMVALFLTSAIFDFIMTILSAPSSISLSRLIGNGVYSLIIGMLIIGLFTLSQDWFKAKSQMRIE